MITTIKPERREDWRQLVAKVFCEDEKLISTYHIMAGASAEECVNDTISRLEKCPTLQFYSLYDNEGGYVGFFGVENIENVKYFTTFGITKNHRNEETEKEFINAVRQIVNDYMVCGLYSRNNRAIRWIEKHGAIFQFDALDESGQQFKTFLIPCQSQPLS